METRLVNSKPAGEAPRHVESLDGLRAVAILAVMFIHAGVPGFDAGWMGVDIFQKLRGVFRAKGRAPGGANSPAGEARGPAKAATGV